MDPLFSVKEEVIYNFREVMDLIPQIVQISDLCVLREVEKTPYNLQRFELERQILHEIMEVLHGKWIIDILFLMLKFKTPSFNDLKKSLSSIGSRILTDRLRLLEEKRVIKRAIASERPLRVSYSLTEFGMGFIGVLKPIFLYWLSNMP